MRKRFNVFFLVILMSLGLLAAVGCDGGAKSDAAGGGAEATGAAIDNGGITTVSTDPALVEKGEALFNEKGCGACHAMDSKRVGPALGDVTERRSADWIARMILHPDLMVKSDPVARQLLDEYKTPMPNQQVKPEEAKAIIAYLGS